MKGIIFSFLFCISSYFSYPQISLAYSNIPATLNTSSLKLIPGGGWLGLQKEEIKGKGKGWGNYTAVVTFQKYDANFKLLKRVDLPSSAGKISDGYCELHQLGNKYYFIYLQAQEGNQLGDIKAIEVNPATMELGEARVIASSQDLGFSLPDFRYTMYLDVFYKTSPSAKSSMFLLMYRDNFFVSSMDENLNPRWKKREATKAIPAGSIHSAEVDDAGNIYIGYSDKLKASYRKYSLTGTSIDRPVVLPEGPANIILFQAKSDTVFVAGTYRKGDNCNGVYKGIVNIKGELASLSSKEFPASLLEPLDKEGWASTKSKKYGITPEFSAELKLSGDGSLIMLAEFSKETGTPGAGYMHAGSIIQVHFGKSEISFARAPKYSVGAALMRYAEHTLRSTSRFYFAFTTSSQTIIIYGDNPENLSRSIEFDAKVVAPSKQILVAARIDKNGNLTREKIIPLPIPGNQPVDPETIAIPVAIKGIDQLVVLKK
jgi:hypothetical protein